MGGTVAAIEAGWFQREIAQSASRFQSEVEAGRRTIVGLNAFVEADEEPIEILKIDESADVLQRQRMAAMRSTRDQATVDARLAELGQAAREDRNIIPAMLDCARVYCTLYEIRHAPSRSGARIVSRYFSKARRGVLYGPHSRGSRNAGHASHEAGTTSGHQLLPQA